LRNLYTIIGTTEQAVSQQRKRTEFEIEKHNRIHDLVLEYRDRHPGCGIYKMYRHLCPLGLGRDKFVCLMSSWGLSHQKPSRPKVTTIPGFLRFPNLIEGMLIYEINRVWQTDITYFCIGLTYYYLIFIIDVYSQIIVGYKVSESMHAIHNLQCLRGAIKKRKIKKRDNLIHHSDRGAQFTSKEYLSVLYKNDIKISMGLKGQDNAYGERINGIIKNEYLNYRTIKTYSELKKWTKQAVLHYNTCRINCKQLNNLSPKIFEEKLLNLSYQNRPKVVMFSKGNYTAKKDESFLNAIPKEERQPYMCPLKLN